MADVRKITKNDILGLEKPQWNKSTDTGEKLCVRRYRLLARVRLRSCAAPPTVGSTQPSV